MKRMLGAFAACALTVLVAVPVAVGRSADRLPASFVGMNLDEGTIASSSLDHELRLMHALGVGVVRFPVYWGQAQPVQGAGPNFAATDRVVGAAARAGLRVMPCVVGAPIWARRYPEQPFSPPASPEPYAAFVSALVSRYGPAGSFWAARPGTPRSPVREWQVWNEENGGYTWSDDQRTLQPPKRTHWVHPYFLLLRATRNAVKRADPRAQIVLGGLVGESWNSLRSLYRLAPPAGPPFDVVALHPYTKLPANVQETVRLSRVVMQHYGDSRKPVVLTELGWPSSVGHIRSAYGFETTEAGQASRLTRVFDLMAASRRVLRTESLFWYDWAEPDSGSFVFFYSGLRRRLSDGRLVAKPAFGAFRRVVRRLQRR